MGSLPEAVVEEWHQRLLVDNVQSIGKAIQRRKRDRECLGIWLNMRAYVDWSALDHAVELWRDRCNDGLPMRVAFCEPEVADVAVEQGTLRQIEKDLFSESQDDLLFRGRVESRVKYLAQELLILLHYHNLTAEDERDEVHAYTFQM